MSTIVSDLVVELDSILQNQGQFKVIVMIINISPENEIESMASNAEITGVSIDRENKECLLEINTGVKSCLTVSEVREIIVGIEPKYKLCVADTTTINDYEVRIDKPVIGFGESHEDLHFCVVCSA